jgi:hypothetical protein
MAYVLDFVAMWRYYCHANFSVCEHRVFHITILKKKTRRRKTAEERRRRRGALSYRKKMLRDKVVILEQNKGPGGEKIDEQNKVMEERKTKIQKGNK